MFAEAGEWDKRRLRSTGLSMNADDYSGIIEYGALANVNPIARMRSSFEKAMKKNP